MIPVKLSDEADPILINDMFKPALNRLVLVIHHGIMQD